MALACLRRVGRRADADGPGRLPSQSREPSLRGSAIGTLIWCLIALAFNSLVWAWRGTEIGVQFLTGYLIEWSLSMDNVFVFAVIFSYFGVPPKYQYRVLFWGIVGAICMRLAFILVGDGADRIGSSGHVAAGLVLDLHWRQAGPAGRRQISIPSKNLLLRLAKRFFRGRRGGSRRAILCSRKRPAA